MKIELYPKNPLESFDLPSGKKLEAIFSYNDTIGYILESDFAFYQFLNALGEYTIGGHKINIQNILVDKNKNELSVIFIVSSPPAVGLVPILLEILPYALFAALIAVGYMALKQINILVSNIGSQILNTPFGIIAAVVVGIYLIYIIFIKKK